MEIRKIITVLLVGCVACIAFAGMCRLAVMRGENKEMVEKEQSEEQTMISITNAPQIQLTMPPKKEEEEVIVSVTMAPMEERTEEPQIQATKAPKSSIEAVQETEDEMLKLPIAAPPTTAPTEVPIMTSTEVSVPIAQTQVPQITDMPATTPIPQSVQEPIATTVPMVEEVHIHDFEKAVWELPTCEKGGYYNNICRICGLEESVSQEPLPHEVEDIVIQEGNCMEDRVIRHVCKICETQVQSDTRYPLYDEHKWGVEEVDGVMLEYCERCGVVK